MDNSLVPSLFVFVFVFPFPLRTRIFVLSNSSYISPLGGMKNKYIYIYTQLKVHCYFRSRYSSPFSRLITFTTLQVGF